MPAIVDRVHCTDHRQFATSLVFVQVQVEKWHRHEFRQSRAVCREAYPAASAATETCVCVGCYLSNHIT